MAQQANEKPRFTNTTVTFEGYLHEAPRRIGSSNVVAATVKASVRCMMRTADGDYEMANGSVFHKIKVLNKQMADNLMAMKPDQLVVVSGGVYLERWYPKDADGKPRYQEVIEVSSIGASFRFQDVEVSKEESEWRKGGQQGGHVEDAPKMQPSHSRGNADEDERPSRRRLKDRKQVIDSGDELE